VESTRARLYAEGLELRSQQLFNLHFVRPGR
jgi:hypothetical protein